jgi:FkbM family methyltransferase
VSFGDDVRLRSMLVEGVAPWVWPKEDIGAWEGPKQDWKYIKEAINTFVKKFDVVVQAGGNCGMYPRFLSDMFETVYTFEPDPLNFHCLVNNCQKSNIIKINAALGETNKLLSVVPLNHQNVGMHKVSEEGVRNIPTFTLDQLALTKCDFILLDCEGYEPNVILGAMETITIFKPVIIVETYTDEIGQLLSPLGYSIKGTIDHFDKILAVD